MADKKETKKVKEEKSVKAKAESKKPEAKSQKPKADSQKQKAKSKTLKKNTTKLRQKRKDKRGKGRKENEDGIDFKIVNIRRVTRMYKGGRRLRFSVFVVVGDKEGKVGVALGKGEDVRSAQQKAISKAKKSMIQVDLKGNTIPHDTTYKKGAAIVMLKPASPGTGVVAGSSMRAVVELAGVKDVLGKIMGTNNKISNAYATLEALKSLRANKI